MNIDPPADNPIVLPGMKRKTSERPPPRPLHGFSWLPTTIRNHFIAMIGEFAGTFLFLFFAFSATQVANAGAAAANEVADTIVANAPNTSVLLYISLAFGFSLAVNVWVFFRISGGLFNPAASALQPSSIAQLIFVGNRGTLSDRRRGLDTGLPCHSCADSWRHRVSCRGFCTLPG